MDVEKIKTWCVEFGMEYGIKLIAALAIFIIGKFIAKLIRKILMSIGEKKNWDKSLTGFLSDITYFLMMTFIVIAAIGKLGVETNSFVAIIGAAGLAIGFALQGSLSNFAAGVMIIVFKPYKVGDYIEGGGVAGSVQSVQVFNTILKSPDNKTIIVQNAGMTGGNIINYSTEPERRIDMTFGIGYDDSIDKARNTISSVLNSENRILPNPTPMIVVSELADSSVNFAVRPWVTSADYWDVYFSLNEKIKKAFDEDGISIPYPQQDIHLHNVSEVAK